MLEARPLFLYLQATLRFTIPVPSGSREATDEETIRKALGHLPAHLRWSETDDLDLRLIEDGGFVLVRGQLVGDAELVLFGEEPQRVLHVRVSACESRATSTMYAHGEIDECVSALRQALASA